MLPSVSTMVVTLALAAPGTVDPPEADGGYGPGSLSTNRSLIFGHVVERDWFHFQIAFGVGGGPDSEGVFHAMEIGGTFSNGWSLSLLHTFIQNKDVWGQKGGPDLFGGWMPQLKVPVFYPEIVLKVAVGPGGFHDQSDGIRAILGVAWSYGVDFHVPFFRASGATVGLQGLHAWAEGRHAFGVATSVGYTFF